ncbi:hypothetical protein [Psychrobacter sp. TAE2020]|nr:hypothetical protein [Psychrobacter sp. TAE2020]
MTDIRPQDYQIINDYNQLNPAIKSSRLYNEDLAPLQSKDRT